MIYTITLNPALDYIIKLKKFTRGEINKSEHESILPGGKGINVSIILEELGINSTAIAFTAGFIGKKIEKELEKYSFIKEFVKVENQISRMNVKILEDDKETAIDGKGPIIEKQDLENLYKKLKDIKSEDIVILAGSIPRGLDENIYANIISKCNEICSEITQDNGKTNNEKNMLKIVVDATGKALLKTLKYKPFLIKPNKKELEEIFETKINSQEEIIEYAKKLKEKGARNVIISMGKEGAILLDENEKIFKMDALNNGKSVNTVGAGDSMVAGFVAGYELFNHDYEKALKMGISAGAATASSLSLGVKKEIYKLFETI